MTSGTKMLQTSALAMFFLISMSALVNSQGLDCPDCWQELREVLEMTKNNGYRASEELSSDLSRTYLQKAAESPSLRCESCWVALSHLMTQPYPKTYHPSGVDRFKSLVKKAMLNNGWV